MAGLNRKLEASSLPECIVAAVILLVCFLITMETLTRVMLVETEPSADVCVEIALRREYCSYGDGKHFPGKYTVCHEWGKIEVEVKDYSPGLQRLTLTAFPEKGKGTVVRYDYLIEIRK